jgi:predicted O-linked N-acetylglucosamine transferase (SPINDLY family)
MSASLLNAIGLEALIVDNLAEYEALAVRLRCDGQRMASFKHKVAMQKVGGHLFNTVATVGHLEKAFNAMWETFEKGGKARIIKL